MVSYKVFYFMYLVFMCYVLFLFFVFCFCFIFAIFTILYLFLSTAFIKNVYIMHLMKYTLFNVCCR